MAIIQRFGLALIFLTRIPWPWPITNIEMNQTRCAAFFPLIGLLIGLLLAGIALLAEQFWSIEISVLLVMLASILLTGAFHEDGLADTSDALGGGFTVEKKLSIMKDSRIGTYGAAALVLGLLLRVGLLAEMLRHDVGLAAACCVAGHAAGRACAVALMAALPYGGDDAHAKAKPLAREVRASDAAWAVAVGLAALCLVGPAAGGLADAARAVVAAGIGLLALLALMQAWLRRRLGGYTGDCLGAVQQTSEVGLLFGVLACL